MDNRNWPSLGGRTYAGHDHFWARAMSRRQFLGTTAGAAVAAATSPLWFPAIVDAAGSDPVPIPGGFAPGFHAFLGANVEPSTIFNYRGTTGVATVQGTGTAVNTQTNVQTSLLFDSDNRFMRGEYIGVDGQRHEGTFGFI